MKMNLFLAVLLFFSPAVVVAQHNHHEESADSAAALGATTQAMSHHHEGHDHMGPHMHMSDLREPQSGDAEKAQHIADQARTALEKYRDYHVALTDGFKIFLPNIPQPMYHFTNNAYAFEAALTFDATKPTSLLYEKHGDDYKLIGAMYTAPVRFSEDQLNQRIPLSMAQWHQHVNMCRPPQGREREMLGRNAQFGLNGSISTREDCNAAGGTFMPHVFGWMVHVYPWEKTPDEIWSVERQIKDKPKTDHGGMN
jgi:hypothetical protein